MHTCRSCLAAAVVLSCITSAPLAAQAAQAGESVAAFPSTPAAQSAKALFDAINSGDSVRLRRWADSSFVPAIYAKEAAGIFDLYRRVQLTSGGLELVRVAGDPWVALDVRLRRTGRLARLGLGMDPGTEAKPLISGWHVIPRSDLAADGRWPREKLSSDSAIRAVIADHVGRSAARDEFSGVVRVSKGNTVLFEQAYGWAHRGLRAPNRPQTRFHIGSQGKMFTAVAIAQLVEAGKLRLTDTLARVLPEYPNHDVARRVTVHQLLTHTSGFGLGPSDEGQTADPNWRTASARSVLAAYRTESLSFEPGTRWQYSNAGYALLAAIVERVSREPFASYIGRHIWEPAGMTRTDFGIVDDPDDDRAVGYGWFNDDPLGANPRRPNWAFVGKRAGGAGGEYSTVEDLQRFSSAFRAGKLVSPAMVELMTTPKMGTQSYGYGFFTHVFNGPDSTRRASAGHGGGGASSGIDGGVFWFTDGSWTVSVLGNHDAPAAQEIIFRLMRFLAFQ